MNDRNPPVPGAGGVYRGSCSDDNDRFLDDPLIPAFHREDQDDYFSLGFVVNWPATSTTETSPAYNAINYEAFLSAVKTECFQGRDHYLFCLPFHALHITVATLFPATKISKLSSQNAEQTTKREKNIYGTANSVCKADQQRSALVDEWKQVLLRASSSHDWPKRPLELELESAQIRNRAGILLWKDHTGGIAKIRHCLEVAAKEAEESSFSAVISENLRIPDIIHTTFLRYQNCEIVQESPKSITDDNDELLLRPSQAHCNLIERVLPNQALFSQNREAEIDDGADKDPCRTFKSSRDSTKFERLVAEVVNLVDCKIYLLDPRKEERHEIFLCLPLKDCKGRADSFCPVTL